MNLTLRQPELERYIDSLVKAGRFPTPEAVVEDALLRAMSEDAVLTDDDLRAIQISERQLEAGQGIDSKEVAAQMRALYSKPQPLQHAIVSCTHPRLSPSSRKFMPSLQRTRPSTRPE